MVEVMRRYGSVARLKRDHAAPVLGVNSERFREAGGRRA
jgi:hypothetical protein